MQKKYIATINGLRFYLFLLILATHYKYIIQISDKGKALYPYLNQAGIFAVLFFFILSGFCIALGYSEKFQTVNKNVVFEFIKKRMCKIYPLYIITGLIMLLLYYLPHNFNWLYAFIFLYIPMIAPFTPFPDGGGNGAGWFVSALCFCYLLTPFIVNKFEKFCNIYSYISIYLIAIIIAIIPVLCTPIELYSSYMYRFPLIRIFHFGVGIVLGIMYVKNTYNLQERFISLKHNLGDIVTLILLLFSILNCKNGDTSNIIFGIPIISFIIIYLCNINNGIIYKVLTHRINQYLGNLSFECYLIHYPIFILLQEYIKPYVSTWFGIIFFYFILLFLTLILSIIYKNIVKYFSNEIKGRNV